MQTPCWPTGSDTASTASRRSSAEGPAETGIGRPDHLQFMDIIAPQPPRWEVVGSDGEAADHLGVELFVCLIARGDAGITESPVPRWLATRRLVTHGRGVLLIRTPRTLQRVLGPADVDAFVAALRTARDRANMAAMLLGALRRSGVLGLSLEDVRVGE
jgi:hypothetical protein